MGLFFSFRRRLVGVVGVQHLWGADADQLGEMLSLDASLWSSGQLSMLSRVHAGLMDLLLGRRG